MRTVLVFVVACLALAGVTLWAVMSTPVAGREATSKVEVNERRTIPKPAARLTFGGRRAAAPIGAANGPASAAEDAAALNARRAQSPAPREAAPDQQDTPETARSAQPDDVDVSPATIWADADRPAQAADDAFVVAFRRWEADPTDVAAFDAAIATAQDARRWVELAELYERGLRHLPDANARRFDYASVLLRLERFSAAADELRLVVGANESFAQGWYNLGIALHATGRLADARDAWSRAIALTPEDTSAFAYRAEVLLALEDWPAAAADLERVLADTPDDAAARVNLAIALLGLDQFDAAIEELDVVRAAAGRDVPLLNHLGRLYQRVGDAAARVGASPAVARQSARACWRASLATVADQPTVRDSLMALDEEPATAPTP